MNLSDFHTLLLTHPKAALRFLLPDGGLIAPHAHITEVARVDKTFVDCGGTLRKLSACLLQAWVADDLDHRLAPSKLGEILERAATVLGSRALPVEIEYEDGLLSQFPVLSAQHTDDTLLFTLGSKHTDCLAKDVCIPNPSAPCEGSGCC